MVPAGVQPHATPPGQHRPAPTSAGVVSTATFSPPTRPRPPCRDAPAAGHRRPRLTVLLARFCASIRHRATACVHHRTAGPPNRQSRAAVVHRVQRQGPHHPHVAGTRPAGPRPTPKAFDDTEPALGIIALTVTPLAFTVVLPGMVAGWVAGHRPGSAPPPPAPHAGAAGLAAVRLGRAPALSRAAPPSADRRWYAPSRPDPMASRRGGYAHVHAPTSRRHAHPAVAGAGRGGRAAGTLRHGLGRGCVRPVILGRVALGRHLRVHGLARAWAAVRIGRRPARHAGRGAGRTAAGGAGAATLTEPPPAVHRFAVHRTPSHRVGRRGPGAGIPPPATLLPWVVPGRRRAHACSLARRAGIRPSQGNARPAAQPAPSCCPPPPPAPPPAASPSPARPPPARSRWSTSCHRPWRSAPCCCRR